MSDNDREDEQLLATIEELQQQVDHLAAENQSLREQGESEANGVMDNLDVTVGNVLQALGLDTLAGHGFPARVDVLVAAAKRFAAERDEARAEVARLNDLLGMKDEDNSRLWDECLSFKRQRGAMVRALGTLGEAGEAAENTAWYELESRSPLAIRASVGRLDPNQAVSVLYTNWRGESGNRRIIPLAVRFACTEWHPEQQWLLEAWDVGKGATRSFAIKDIHEWNLAPTGDRAGAKGGEGA